MKRLEIKVRNLRSKGPVAVLVKKKSRKSKTRTKA